MASVVLFCLFYVFLCATLIFEYRTLTEEGQEVSTVRGSPALVDKTEPVNDT